MSTFILREHLAHTWTNELVGFPVDVAELALLGPTPGVRNEKVRLQPCQLRREADGRTRVFFEVDELPALGERRFDFAPAAKLRVRNPFRTAVRGEVVQLGNGLVSVRIPGPQESCERFPAPVLAVRRGTGRWLGSGRFRLSSELKPARVESALVEQGPLWLTWRVRWLCASGAAYTVEYRLHAGRPYVEITEASELCREAHWEFSLKKGLAPDHSWTHPHQLRRDEPARVRPLPFAGAAAKPNIGSVQLPIYSGIWIPDDYAYAGLLRREGEAPDCIAVAGVNGGFWDYPYANQIDLQVGTDGDAWFQGSVKAGHRRWLLLAVERDALLSAAPYYRNPVHAAMKAYETPLDKVKDYVLDWPEVPAGARPFLLADREQLGHARRVAREYPPLRDYVAALNPALPGDYTYYHSGTHRTFEPDYRNDPAVLYVTGGDEAAWRQQAAFLKDVVLNGLRSRREGMLAHVGHCDGESASINVGRGLRPWAALYDFAAAEGAFSPAEQRLARATFAFYCYKISDPDYWPADHLVFRDDHPRSAHRTHWFPGRQSDWAFYNIDNIPHNFHGDLWSAMGCVAMTFPCHPESRRWVERTLAWWECELTQWIFPEGAWLESTTYTLNSMKDYLIYCRALANSRIRDYFSDERLRRVFRATAEMLLPYDERILGCSIPVLGDASYPNGFAYVLGWMAGLCKSDPEFAGLMRGAWGRTGEYLTEPGRFGLNFCDFLFLDPFLEPRPLPAPGSTWYHGLGAMLRHGAGTPGDIYLFIKAGIIYSHFHEPEGTFLLWWNSRPLCDEFGVQYGQDTSLPCNHNCIEVRGGGDACCYNKGDITRFVTTAAFDHVLVEAPIHQAYIREGESLWGFRGETGPNGWHRRQFLLVKPCYLAVCDDLECPYPTTYHLSVKAATCEAHGAHVHCAGELGVDLEFLALDLDGREIRFSEFDVAPTSKYGFQPPPGFYHQRQLHIDGAPHQGYRTLLVPHAPDVPAAVAPDAATGGARVRLGDATDRVLLFPAKRVVQAGDLDYEGRAGVVRTAGDGTLTLHQAEGTRIGLAGRLVLAGDGPFTAVHGTDGRLRLQTAGGGRWLLAYGATFTALTCDGATGAIEHIGSGWQRFYVPAGQHAFELR